MSKHLERDLEQLERDLLAQSAKVEEMIRTACRALCERRADLAYSLFSREGEINQREVTIEEECLKILALHQPVAVDLRRTAIVLKINSDLERIADLAVNIAERTQAIATHPELEIPAALERMVVVAISMVRDALDSFVDLDVDLAREVCIRDDEVDDLNREVIGELQVVMAERSNLIDVALQFFSASRHIERIADHATNIAEDVIYLVEGEIARHRHEDTKPPNHSSK